MKNFIKKYLNQRNRNIISIFIIIFGIGYLINYSFFSPTYVNKYIATNIYKEPANSYFDDENFYQCVVDAYNNENNAELPYTTNLSDEELQSIKTLECSGYGKSDNKKIASAKGLEKLTSLENLYLSFNQLTSIDITNNTELLTIDITMNKLINLDTSTNTKLFKIEASSNLLETLNLSNNTKLEYLYLGVLSENNSYYSGVYDENICDKYYCNKIKKLNISSSEELEYLDLTGNQLEELDISNNKKLKELLLNNNRLSSLDLSKNSNLTELYLHNNQLVGIDVNNNPLLKSLNARNNQLSELDVSNNLELLDLYVSDNQLVSLNLNNNSKLEFLGAFSNNLVNLVLSNDGNLKYLDIGQNQLTELDVSNNSKILRLSLEYNQITNLDVSNNLELTNLNVANNQLTNLDLIKNTALTYLYTGYNQLTSLDVSNNTKLTSLSVNNNQLTELDVSNNLELEDLNVRDNQLTSLDLSNNNKIKNLYIDKSIRNNITINNDIELDNLVLSDNKYIYLGDSYDCIDNNIDNFSINNITFNNLNWAVSTNYDSISINNNIVTGNKIGKSYTYGKDNDKNRITYYTYVYDITSNKYEIDKDNNIIIDDDYDKNKLLNSISINYGDIDDRYKVLTKEVVDDKLVIKYKDNTIKEFNIIKGIEFGKLKVNNHNIVLDKEVETSYREFVSNITTKEGYSYKIYNNDEEIDENNNIIGGMILKVYYNEEEVDSYNITYDYLEFDKELDIVEDIKLINNIIVGSTIESIKNGIKTSGNISVVDKNNNVISNLDNKIKTGDKFKIDVYGSILEYTASVKGDSTGDGEIDVMDIIDIVDTIIDNKEIEKAYYNASDYNNDNTIDVMDIIDIVDYIVK